MKKILKALCLFSVCVMLCGCTMTQKKTGQKVENGIGVGISREVSMLQQDMSESFAYVNGQNQLCLWRENGTEPLVLSETWISMNNMIFDKKSLEKSTVDITEEDIEENRDKNIENDTVVEAEENREDDSWIDEISFESSVKVIVDKDGKGVYYPSNILFYPIKEGRVLPIFQLEYKNAVGQTKRIAESVYEFTLDEEGRLWYSTVEVTATEYDLNLYCYDGKENHFIFKLGKEGKGSWQITKKGDFAVFLGEDGKLHAWEKGEDTHKVLSEQTQEEFYLSEEGDKVVARNGSQIQLIFFNETGNKEITTIPDQWTEVYLLGENTEHLLLVNKKTVFWEDLLYNDRPSEEKWNNIWEAISEMSIQYDISKHEFALYDINTNSYLERKNGFVLESLEYEEMEPIREYFFLEMIAEESYEKLPLSRYISEDLAEDFVENYENYGETFLSNINDMDPFYELAKGYLIGKGRCHVFEEMDFSGQVEVRKSYNSQTEELYIRIIRYLETENYDIVYSGEDVYQFDREGKGKKVVEYAGQARVIQDDLYYTRSYGAENGENSMQKLFSLKKEGAILEAESIDMDRMRKSADGKKHYYLTGTLGIYDPLPGTLWVMEGTDQIELGEKVFDFLLYGKDSVAVIQSTIEGEGEEFMLEVLMSQEESPRRLIVIEDGVETVIEEDIISYFKIQ